MTISLKQVDIVMGEPYLNSRVTTNQRHKIDSHRKKERNSSILQKKTSKRQKEKQKEEMSREELQKQLENKV